MNEVVRWPAQIPKEQRKHLLGGRSFVFSRNATWSGAFEDQLMQVSRYMIVLPVHGEMQLKQKDGPRYKLGNGGAAILWDTELMMTESAGDDGYFQSLIWFFDVKTIGLMFPEAPWVEHGDLPKISGNLLRFFVPDALLKCKFGLDIFIGDILGMPSRCGSVAKHLDDILFAPRREIEGFLEQLVELPRSRHRQVLKTYPGGEEALLKAMAKLGMPSVTRAVADCKARLCQKLRRQGVSQAEIYSRLRIKGPKPQRR